MLQMLNPAAEVTDFFSVICLANGEKKPTYTTVSGHVYKKLHVVTTIHKH